MDALKKEKIKKAAWFEKRTDLNERLKALDIGGSRNLLKARDLAFTKEEKREALYNRIRSDLFDEAHIKRDLLDLSDLGVKSVKEIFDDHDFIDSYAYMSMRNLIDLGYFTKISHYRFTYDEETKEKVLTILSDPAFDDKRHKYVTMKALDEYVSYLYLEISFDDLYHLWTCCIKDTTPDEFFTKINSVEATPL
jgi:hypothetical protein